MLTYTLYIVGLFEEMRGKRVNTTEINCICAGKRHNEMH
jgi:predicted hydrocarbon binding protein